MHTLYMYTYMVVNDMLTQFTLYSSHMFVYDKSVCIRFLSIYIAIITGNVDRTCSWTSSICLPLQEVVDIQSANRPSIITSCSHFTSP